MTRSTKVAKQRHRSREGKTKWLLLEVGFAEVLVLKMDENKPPTDVEPTSTELQDTKQLQDLPCVNLDSEAKENLLKNDKEISVSSKHVFYYVSKPI